MITLVFVDAGEADESSSVSVFLALLRFAMVDVGERRLLCMIIKGGKHYLSIFLSFLPLGEKMMESEGGEGTCRG